MHTVWNLAGGGSAGHEMNANEDVAASQRLRRRLEEESEGKDESVAVDENVSVGVGVDENEEVITAAQIAEDVRAVEKKLGPSN